MASHMTREKPLNLTDRQGKMLPAWQAYQKLYYNEKLKPIVEAEWEQHVARNPGLAEKKGVPLAWCNNLIRGLLGAETDEVKVEVDRRRKEGIFPEDVTIHLGDDHAIDSIERRRLENALALQR
jgi:hypothetical protein